MKIGIRTWILIFVLFLAFLSIAPWKTLEKGVLITSVEKNSTAFNEGIRQGQIITAIDGNQINTIEDYSNITHEKFIGSENLKTIILTDGGEFVLYSSNPPEITVSTIPKSKIKTGLDLSGGSKALVKAKDRDLTSKELNDLISVVENRINVYGISDVRIVPVIDLTGNNYMSIEIAGATPKDLNDLISEQGKFEARIGNETAFIGGDKDITSVCRNDATCAGIEGCQQSETGYYCSFRFVIYLSEAAAQKHADITSKLETNSSNAQYLSKTLDLYLDDNQVDSLFISKDLKGRATTQIQIQGSGVGQTQEEAYDSAIQSMNQLQTVLITGSLPFKLEIVKLDVISPSLGKEFTKNVIYLAVIVFLIVSIILFFKYRKMKITLSVILTMFSEVFITLGVASFISWNLDVPSIAGIIAGMGTGVNDQIVILDESVSNMHISLKERIKRALFIIFGAFFTIVVAMLPLFWAGAGMLKGFALTTIIGVTVGILITRPAFAEIIRKIQE